MLETIVEIAPAAWPLALTCATVIAADRVRAGRRRERLNRCLHELRRPLQALVLDRSADARRPGGTQLDLALDALTRLDREINGGVPRRVKRLVDGRSLIEDARARWGASAAVAGRRIEVAWRASGSRVVCDPAAIARALDNLIANALEHGTGAIGLAGVSRDGRLRLVVFDDGASGSGERVCPPLAGRHPGGATALAPPRRLGAVVAAHRPGAPGVARDPRRGHGLRVVAEIAAEHGGRFATCRDRAGASAVLEIPLADG
jgi:hypothetical protein